VYKHGVWGEEIGLKCEEIVFDCTGVYNGDAYNDSCGVCDADPTNDCARDCHGIFGGDAYLDGCYVCDDNVYNDCPYEFTIEFVAGAFDTASSNFDYPALKDAVENALCEHFESVFSNTICSVTSMLMLDGRRRRLSIDPPILPDNTTNTSHVAVLKHASVVAFVSVINAINQAHYDLLNETTPIAVSDEAVALVSSLEAAELQTSIANNLMDSNHEAMANEVAITDYSIDDGVQHAPETVDDDDSGSKWDWLTETHTLIGVAVGAACMLILALVLRYACRSSVKPSQELDLTSSSSSSNKGTINTLCDDDEHRGIELPKTPSHSLDIVFGNEGDDIDSTTGV